MKMKDADRAAAAFEAPDRQAPRRGEVLHHRGGGDAAAQERRQGRYFAEKGLAKAKETRNRDLEGHCQELLAAAKRA